MFLIGYTNHGSRFSMPVPSLPLPPPLRGLDGSFTYYTITRRLPRLARQVIADHPWPPEIAARLEQLAAELPAGVVRPFEDPGAPDEAEWQGWMQPYLGQSWLEAPWFVIETYFFRLILAATGFFQPGPGQGLDPYQAQKEAGLQQALSALPALLQQIAASQARGEQEFSHQLVGLFLRGVWSNQSDLSMWPAGSQQPQRSGSLSQFDHLVHDQTAQVADWLLQRRPLPRVDYILDNGGLELAHDLVLVDFLLSHHLVEKVFLHCKFYPTYVSDVTSTDLHATIARFCRAQEPLLAALGERLAAQLQEGRLACRDHRFWVSPLSGWEMAETLYTDLAQSGLLISKGDANYRRWLGDRHWAPETSLAAILSYLPAPWLALRVLKAEVIAGLQPGVAEGTRQQDAEWLFSGRWGLAQALL